MDWNTLGTNFAVLTFPLIVVTLFINIGKWAGFVKDGTSNTWSAGLNLVFFVIFAVLNIWKPALDWTVIDSTVASIGNIGLALVGVLFQIFGSKVANAGVRGLPLVGTSFSE